MAKLFDALEEQIVNGQSAVLSIYKSYRIRAAVQASYVESQKRARVRTVSGGAVEYESELFAHRLLKEKKSVQNITALPEMTCGILERYLAAGMTSASPMWTQMKQWQEMARAAGQWKRRRICLAADRV